MVDANRIIGSLLNIYNNGNLVTDPTAPRTGSFFFGPNQELVFRDRAPKGKVTAGLTFSDNKGFGTPANREKNYNIAVAFVTQHGFVDPNTGLKNEQLVNQYMSLIEDVTVANVGSIGEVQLIDIEMEDEPFHDQESQVYIGITCIQ